MRRLVSLFVVGFLVAGGAAACSSGSDNNASTDTTAASTDTTAATTDTTVASTDTTAASTDTTAASTDTTAASTDTTAASTDTSGAVPAGAEEFCAVNDELTDVLGPYLDNPAAYADVVDSGLLDDIVATAPAEIADQVALAADAINAMADRRVDPSQGAGDVSAALDALDGFCGVATP